LIIYKVTNTVNGKIYIGQTINSLDHRKSGHYRDLRARKVNYGAFHNALAKYKEDEFIWEIIDNADSIDELNQKEQYWISFYDSTNKEKGYNRDSGGSNCKKSKETLEKIGAKTKERFLNPDFKKTVLNGLKDGTKKWQEKCKAKRVSWVCPFCGTVIENLPPWEAKKKKVCSVKCPEYKVNPKGLTLANERNKERFEARDREIRDFIYAWCLYHKEYIYKCPKNKIAPAYKGLIDIIQEKFGVMDFRSMIRTVIGSYNRKMFVQHIDAYIENH
jgi:hypothetical protein